MDLINYWFLVLSEWEFLKQRGSLNYRQHDFGMQIIPPSFYAFLAWTQIARGGRLMAGKHELGMGDSYSRGGRTSTKVYCQWKGVIYSQCTKNSLRLIWAKSKEFFKMPTQHLVLPTLRQYSQAQCPQRKCLLWSSVSWCTLLGAVDFVILYKERDGHTGCWCVYLFI